MGKKVIPQKEIVWCDVCKKEPSKEAKRTGWVEARVTFVDRDFSGGVVHSHALELCIPCGHDLRNYITEVTTKASSE